jgi:glycosyltransferase involved in cell wall biosynthesis
MIQTQASVTTLSETMLSKPRVGVICDFVEENWPSMDLVADMVLRHLEREQASSIDVTRICPPLHSRFGRLPGIGTAPALHNADRLLNRFVDYSRYLKPRIGNFDLFHLIDHSYSQLIHDLPADRTVVTCHDLDTFVCVLEPEREPRPRWFRAMVNRVLSGFQKAAHVIADSEATRAEILRFGLHPPERITVVVNGVCPPLPDPAADSELSNLLGGASEAHRPPNAAPSQRGTSGSAALEPSPLCASSSDDTIWLLSVGSAIPRKRLDVLLRVFAEVRKHAVNVRLLRIGAAFTPEQRELARILEVESAVLELGFVSREILTAAYRRADVLLQTSDAEGFGLPPVEAMACGCQVIASDLAVLREVGGAAATYCAVGDIDVWKDAIVRAIERRQDPEHRKLDRERSLANAARFSWSENAARTARVYEQVLGKARTSALYGRQM